MKPLIGITAGEIYNKNETWSPFTYAQSHTYVDAIVAAGGAPIILPITGDEETLRALYERCDGILIAGGNDVEPERYGQAILATCGEVSPRRDAQEVQLISWALEDDKPLLGICRGMQLLNVVLGGTLYQDIATELPDVSDHQVSLHARDIIHIAHELTIQPESRLAGILNSTSIGANSYHHQAVKTLGDGIVAVGWAEDQIIEAIELPGKDFVYGIQAHPESIQAKAEPQWQKLFQAFVRASMREPAVL